MKKKDLGVILLVAVFSAISSIFLSGVIFSTPEDRQQSVEVVEPISINFDNPDATYFNSGSINPVKKIEIGQEPNSKPFEDR